MVPSDRAEAKGWRDTNQGGAPNAAWRAGGGRGKQSRGRRRRPRGPGGGAPHLVVEHHLVQLLGCLAHAVAVVRVDDVDQALRARVVVSPQRSNTVLTSHVLCRRGRQARRCGASAGVRQGGWGSLRCAAQQRRSAARWLGQQTVGLGLDTHPNAESYLPVSAVLDVEVQCWYCRHVRVNLLLSFF